MLHNGERSFLPAPTPARKGQKLNDGAPQVFATRKDSLDPKIQAHLLINLESGAFSEDCNWIEIVNSNKALCGDPNDLEDGKLV